jgi:uncharacterized membrane protein YeaQ/YmgE (transglycosylase-associated protein family)
VVGSWKKRYRENRSQDRPSRHIKAAREQGHGGLKYRGHWGGNAMPEIQILIIWLVIGAIAGWLAGQIVTGGGFGLVGDIVVGIVGAIVGGWLLPRIGIFIGGGFIAQIINAVIGAVVVLLVVRLVVRR